MQVTDILDRAEVDSILSNFTVATYGCWIPIGCKVNDFGYSTAVLSGEKVLLHRLFYSEIVGRIGTEIKLGHACKNKACVNPEHLYVR